MAYRGRYKVKNPSKYKGDPTKITYRSGLELTVMNWLDRHPDVLEWSSEEVIIPYRSPIDNKVHRYFTDFYVKRKLADGTIDQSVIEVKPRAQCSEPKKQTRRTRRYINEVRTWGVNTSKWQAAKQYCDARGWKFVILTEKEITGMSY